MVFIFVLYWELYLYKCNCNCTVKLFIVCSMCPLMLCSFVCCALFESGRLFCMLYPMIRVLPLPPGKNQFAVKVNKNKNTWSRLWMYNYVANTYNCDSESRWRLQSHPTRKYGHESRGTWNHESLCWGGLAAIRQKKANQLKLRESWVVAGRWEHKHGRWRISTDESRHQATTSKIIEDFVRVAVTVVFRACKPVRTL
jgi:hypothetical protein